MSLIRAGLDTLELRREELTKRFFQAQCDARDVVPPIRPICCRTSVTSPSQADCAKQEQSNLLNQEL